MGNKLISTLLILKSYLRSILFIVLLIPLSILNYWNLFTCSFGMHRSHLFAYDSIDSFIPLLRLQYKPASCTLSFTAANHKIIQNLFRAITLLDYLQLLARSSVVWLIYTRRPTPLNICYWRRDRLLVTDAPHQLAYLLHIKLLQSADHS